ncbi:MAG: hypothetical protein V3S16_03170, partial [Candidatus Desulfatibia sp.]
MQLNENKVIEFLAENYGGSLATRALWIWAGGQAGDIDYIKPALDQWSMLWEKAKEDLAPSKIALLREALFDHIGNDTILGYLNAIADDEFEGGRKAAPVLIFLLEKLDPEFDEKEIQAAMLSFPKGFSEDADEPENPSKESLTEAIFAALAAAVQNRFKKDARSVLEEKCETLIKEKIPASAGLISGGMLVLLQCLPEMAQASNTPEVQEVTQAIQGILKTLTKKEDAGEAIGKLTPLLEKLKTLADDSGDEMFSAASNSLDYQFKFLKTLSEETPLHSFECLARALIQALWGT